MPVHTVARDLAEGRLVELSIEEVPPGGLPLSMFAIYREGEPPGPAGRWMIEHLKNCPGGTRKGRGLPGNQAGVTTGSQAG
jgi:DNA-binding transcriptional LysR family regulator